MNLENRREMRALMEQYHITAQKKYGQNFLTDEGVLDGIIDAADLSDTDTVLEIGPGLGTLTRRLSKAVGKVIAVEIDSNLIPILQDTLAGYDNVSVINEDIMKCNLSDLMIEKGVTGKIKVVANLPYYITTPIVLNLLEYADKIESITVMIQKEVAVRMQAGPGSKDYGALSLAVQYYSEPKIVVSAPAECFFPMPGVDSVVIRLTMRDEPLVDVENVDLFFKIIRGTFNLRRKTLPNALSSAGLGISRSQVTQVLSDMKISETIRGETFTMETFAEFTDRLIHYM